MKLTSHLSADPSLSRAERTSTLGLQKALEHARFPRNRRDRTAFSLIEVLCAILILGVGLVGLTEAVTLALSSNRESEQQTTAALFAAGLVETMRADGVVVDGETEGNCGEGLALYRWRENVSPTSIDGLHDVSVVVENTKSGQAIYELRTLLFEPPEDLTSPGAGKTSSSRKRRSG